MQTKIFAAISLNNQISLAKTLEKLEELGELKLFYISEFKGNLKTRNFDYSNFFQGSVTTSYRESTTVPAYFPEVGVQFVEFLYRAATYLSK